MSFGRIDDDQRELAVRIVESHRVLNITHQIATTKLSNKEIAQRLLKNKILKALMKTPTPRVADEEHRLVPEPDEQREDRGGHEQRQLADVEPQEEGEAMTLPSFYDCRRCGLRRTATEVGEAGGRVPPLRVPPDEGDLPRPSTSCLPSGRRMRQTKTR